ncbi:hypothetical protein D3C72_1862120 [compost metagenome]
MGYAREYQNFIYVNTDLLENTASTIAGMPYAGTGLTTTGEGTIERTFSHEAGHSSGMAYHEDLGKNRGGLMHFSSNKKDAGMKLRESQVLKMESDYKAGLLNQGEQVEDVYVPEFKKLKQQ